jgi:threonine/homoserine/homoserine lactone efflux protein
MFDLWPDLMRGLVVGVSIAAPVGPIGVLCIRNTLAHGWPTGVAAGMGAAVADALYAMIGALGISAIIALLDAAGVYLRLLGIGLLLWIAWSTWRKTEPTSDSNVNPTPTPSATRAFISTFALTMANPMTILSFAAIFAGAGVGMQTNGSPESLRTIALVTGTFIGSAAWWLTLSGGVSVLRNKVDSRAMRGINIASAMILLGFALWMLGQTLGLV